MPKATGFAEAMARALDGRPARVFDLCASTNDEALTWARDGAPHLAVVVSDAQRAGRGRRGRTWAAEPGDALLCSIVVRPALPVSRWGTVPLIAGVAVQRAIRARTTVDARLKWPNDLLAGDRKLGGILCEADPPHSVVCGIGVNVSAAPPGVPAVSLAELGAMRLDRADLLQAILHEIDAAFTDPEDAVRDYAGLCSTLGRRVRVARADGAEIHGIAETLDPGGALMLREDGGELTRIDAGDVEHLRPV